MRIYLHIPVTLLLFIFISLSLFTGGCAQIGMPTGGAKDTVSPKLIKATPVFGSVNVKSNKITLAFNEYIDVQEVQKNLIISPFQNKNPTIISDLKSITIKFKDTLLPNTTYTLNFGDAIKDVNEGNIYKNLTYVFSTGSKLDSLSITGKIILAETGGVDSTLMVMLYSNAVDSTVTKKKPNYIAKVNGDGSFEFINLPASTFKIYALKDGDGSKTYNAKSENFAFLDTSINAANKEPVILYAYTEEKEKLNNVPIIVTKKVLDKKLRVTTSLQTKQDLFEPLEIYFNNPIKFFDSTKVFITDTNYKKITGLLFSKDSTSKKITITTKWKADIPLILIIDTLAAKDSLGNKIGKIDTLRFSTKRAEDYGRLILHFNDLDLKKIPILQFLNGEEVKFSYPITNKDWINNMFHPGEYGIRIIYDTDKNSKWTTGNYFKKLQPETSVTLPQKLTVKADWDNEREINL